MPQSNPIHPSSNNSLTDPFINLTPESLSIHSNLFTYDTILSHPVNPPCIGFRSNPSLLPNLCTFIMNNVLSIEDLFWWTLEDYEDQSVTLTALTTTHYHFCPWTCEKGHDEEHILLIYLWDYLDWYQCEFLPPCLVIMRSHTVAAFRGCNVTPTSFNPNLSFTNEAKSSSDLARV